MPNLTHSNRLVKAVPPPVRPPGTLPFDPLEPDIPGPVSAFARLHAALAERDFVSARKATRDLRTLGYSVAVLGPRGEGGRS